MKVVPVIVDGNPLDIRLTNNIFHIPDMAKWIGVDPVGQFHFSDNFLLNKYITNNHIIRKTRLSDLHQLLNLPEYQGKRDKNIRPKMLLKFWNNCFVP